VQILDGREGKDYTSRGDVFGIWGARMTPGRPHPSGRMQCPPDEKRARPSPEWNLYRVTSRGGVLKLAVNGKEVSGAFGGSPRKGYLCLEAEGSECHFRNLRIRELPSTNPTEAETATPDQGFVSLYSGLDLRGWKSDPGHAEHWGAKDPTLAYDGKSGAKDKDLWTEKGYGDSRTIVDRRLPGEPKPRPRAVVLPNGDDARNPDGTPKTLQVPYAGDGGIPIRGSEKAQVNITCDTVGSGELYGYRTDRTLPTEARAAGIPKVKADRPPGPWNRFEIALGRERLTVLPNGKAVIEGARLPGLPGRGPIGLQCHGDPVQFTNLFLREIG
jgi:hypothetical protein